MVITSQPQQILVAAHDEIRGRRQHVFEDGVVRRTGRKEASIFRLGTGIF
jgi:hypothetical protein